MSIIKNVLAVVLLAVAMPGHAQLVINEIMQSNVECIMDDIKEFPDSWVELYNPTDADINLKDYQISNKNKVKKAWQLPDKTVGKTIVCTLISVWNQPRVVHFIFSRTKGQSLLTASLM